MSASAAALASKVTTQSDGTVILPSGVPANRGPIGVKIAPTAAKAKPSKNGKPAAKKAKPAKAAATRGAGPSGSERAVLILKALSKHPGGTLQDVMKWTKLNDRAAYHHLWHLRKDGFVRSATADEVGVMFELTAKGKAAARKAG